MCCNGVSFSHEGTDHCTTCPQAAIQCLHMLFHQGDCTQLFKCFCHYCPLLLCSDFDQPVCLMCKDNSCLYLAKRACILSRGLQSNHTPCTILICLRGASSIVLPGLPIGGHVWLFLMRGSSGQPSPPSIVLQQRMYM